MKFQKTLCVISAFTLALLCGCGDSSKSAGEAPAIEEVSAESTESVTTTEITTLTETATSTTVTETTAVTTETTGAVSNPTEPDSGESLTLGLQKRIEEWDKGAVQMKIHCEQETAAEGLDIPTVVDMDIYTYQKKSSLYMNMFGFEMRTIYDGTYTYQIDENTKTVSKKKTDSMEESDMAAENALDEVDANDFVGKGRELLNNIETVYEEFKTTDDDGESQKIKFFYDEAGNLIGCKVTDNTGKEVFFDYTITFTEDADMTKFNIPSGYTEVSEEDMAANLAASMFAALGKLLEAAGVNE